MKYLTYRMYTSSPRSNGRFLGRRTPDAAAASQDAAMWKSLARICKSGLSAAAVVLVFGSSHPAAAQESTPAAEAQQTYQEIKEIFGFVPVFIKSYPPGAIAGTWTQLQDLWMSTETALSGREKDLIGLAVAAQIPCSYCVYSHTKFAKLNGATEEEIQEAVAMAAMVRQWSTMLHGAAVDEEQYRREADQIAADIEQQMKAAAASE